MSRLSLLFHRYQTTGVVSSIVSYLETVDIPGPERKKIAVSLLKLLHVQTGGVWDEVLEKAAEGAIEYVLSSIRTYVGRAAGTSPVEPRP